LGSSIINCLASRARTTGLNGFSSALENAKNIDSQQNFNFSKPTWSQNLLPEAEHFNRPSYSVMFGTFSGNNKKRNAESRESIKIEYSISCCLHDNFLAKAVLDDR
jgi:hypothetical protein